MTIYPDNTFVSNVYNAAGYPVRVRDRANRWTVNSYDAAGHVIRVDYPNGDWVKKEYTGNLVSQLMDAAGNTTEYFYCYEQLTGVRFPDGSTRAAGFDNFNRQIWAVDERGVAVTNTYDKLDRVIASAYVPFASQDDMPPDVTSVPDTLQPATCNSALIYGGFDNQVISYAYDQVGNPLSMTDWAGTITNAYDALNRRVIEHTQYSTLQYSLSFAYDLLDNRLGMTLETPQNTLISGYSYDALNRLAALTHNGLKQISVTNIYNPNGKLASVIAKENGTTRSARTFSYDSEQRLSAINGSYSGVEKLALTYAYNNAQQITTLGESIEGESQTYTFVYDQRDQLTNETVSGATTVYGYDKAQNRIMKKTGAATPDAYSFTFANKLTNIHVGAQNANNRYWYDIAGNLVTSVVNNITNTYAYNAQNKVACVNLIDAEAYSHGYVFSYDSLNRRVRITKTTSVPPPGRGTSQVGRYIVHDGNVPIAETDNNALLCRTFVRGVGIAEGTGDAITEIIGTDGDDAQAVFYLSNHRGDTLAAYRDSSTLVANYRYDAFGNHRTAYCVVNEPENAPRYTFSTKEYLSDAKLYLYAYRVYDPLAGRWTQRDPIDYQDSLNLYQFCGNNPINRVDGTGLDTNFINHASGYYHTNRYSYYAQIDRRFHAFGFKCNLFVFEATRDAGMSPLSVPVDPKNPNGPTRPATAAELANPNIDIPGWSKPTTDVKPGDVISNGDHCGILVDKDHSLSASSKTQQVENNDWHVRSSSTVSGRRPIQPRQSPVVGPLPPQSNDSIPKSKEPKK